MKKVMLLSAVLVALAATFAMAGEWTCSMHPQIRQPEQGTCPLCAMDLIEVSDDSSADLGPREIKLSPHAEKLADLESSRVRRGRANVDIPLFGSIELDETRVARLSAWAGGRIQKLHVNSVGENVQAGDPLAELYSPDLIAAQEEFLQALVLGAGEIAREKLLLLGMDSRDIDALETGGKVRQFVLLRAPAGGVVLEKNVVEGDWVKLGSELFTVADLSRVWVQMEAYESDLSWLAEGQRVNFEADAMPGEKFEGRVSFIDPVFDGKRRSLHLRVEADNPLGLLRPGLFVRGEVAAEYNGETDPMLIPASAPLLTGRRAIAYVNLGEGHYEGREIKLGPRAGDNYIVLAGLEEGERVVSEGAFKIDSELQIKGKPSMMSSADASPTAFLKSLDPFYQAYFELSEALSLDKTGDADAVLKTLDAVQGDLLEGEEAENWESLSKRLRKAAKKTAKESKLAERREAFESLSLAMISLAESFGASGEVPVHLYHCPMAFDWKGADWLQNREGVENPYWGSQMYRCGSLKETLVAGSKAEDVPAPAQDHSGHMH
jgi:membrane fusion protein, copper/silver efflux system